MGGAAPRSGGAGAPGDHPDQRGFGRVPLPLGSEPPSLDLVADDLARTLDGHGIGRFLLVGSSMGAYTAMAFLRRHPGRATGLALLSARATADDPEARAQRLGFAEAIGDDRARERLIARTTPCWSAPARAGGARSSSTGCWPTYAGRTRPRSPGPSGRSPRAPTPRTRSVPPTCPPS
ncbi:alpha/beta fold hydrolase [Streptomyces sp. MS1.HAVA.3]|uniref:Alpha/beta fold hydrolase n=1 Tax=Streptomyces caledonius TaxID=3134107 RepID=A0ABU8U499_9ACTN